MSDIRLNSTADVTITVVDEDDQNPVFNQTIYQGYVQENASRVRNCGLFIRDKYRKTYLDSICLLVVSHTVHQEEKTIFHLTSINADT